MTYLLGSKCIDGVVLVGDRKVITEKNRIRWEDKINSPFFPVVWCSAGYQEFSDSFENQVNSKIGRFRWDKPKEPLTFEDFAIFLQQAYQDMIALHGEDEIRFGGLSVLVAQRPKRFSELWVVDGHRPIKKEARYYAIGSGEQYGELFLSKLWNEQLSMKEVAVLGCFVIKTIEDFQLDESVGVGEKRPQVWFIPDNPPTVDTEEAKDSTIREAQSPLVEKLWSKASSMVNKADGFFETLKEPVKAKGPEPN